MNKSVDLSHTINEKMPVYPGTPLTVINKACKHESDGFAELSLCFSSHIGTHIDVPYHIIPSGGTITDLPIDNFMGKAFKINSSRLSDNLVAQIKEKITLYGIPDFIILQTNWDKNWGKPEYLSVFPLPDMSTFKYLSELKLKGVGIDAISIDAINSETFMAHQYILGSDKIIIENLRNLDNVPDSMFEFFCLPLKIENGDGSPVRAIARLID